MEVSDEYAANLIKKYKFWDLFVNPKQYYLGRCYIWWRDKSPGEGERLTYRSLPADALLETQTIWLEVARCCRGLGYQTEPYGEHFSINGPLLLANERDKHGGHMHMHFVPRTRPNFLSQSIGVETLDENFERMYRSDASRPLNVEQMEKLRRICRLYAIA